jgi:hypothetical protein
MRKLMLITLLLFGCWGEKSKSSEPVLPAAEIAYPAPPKMAAYTDAVVAPLYPESGVWNLELEYAVSQRAIGKPDLDIRAKGTYTLDGVADGFPVASNASVTVRPNAIQLQSSLKKALPSLISRMAPQSQPDGTWAASELVWKTIGQSDTSVVLRTDASSTSAWLLVDKDGVVRGSYKETGDEYRKDLNARQKWRITLNIKRRDL